MYNVNYVVIPRFIKETFAAANITCIRDLNKLDSILSATEKKYYATVNGSYAIEQYGLKDSLLKCQADERFEKIHNYSINDLFYMLFCGTSMANNVGDSSLITFEIQSIDVGFIALHPILADSCSKNACMTSLMYEVYKLNGVKGIVKTNLFDSVLSNRQIRPV